MLKIALTRLQKRALILFGTLVLVLAGLGAAYAYFGSVEAVLTAVNWPQAGGKDEGGETKGQLDIVAIGDFSGRTKFIGNDLVAGFKDSTQAAGIADKVRILIRDDRGDPLATSALVDGAAAGFSTLGVVGPTQIRGYDGFAQSVEEGMVPALVPISPPVTKTKSKYSFSLQANQKKQGEFIGNLMRSIKPAHRLAFVNMNDLGPDSIWDGIQKGYRLGKSDDTKFLLWPTDNEPAAVKSLLDSLSSYETVFFNLSTGHGVELVKHLKDAGFKGQLVGLNEAALSSFPSQFSALPREQQSPGFYTDQLIGISPYSPDVASERSQQLSQQYQKANKTEPSWAYAYGYDSGFILGQFFQQMAKTGVDLKAMQPEEVREKLQQYLKGLGNGRSGLEAYTGPIRFDQNQERDVPPMVVIFRGKRPAPFFLQYSTEAPQYVYDAAQVDNKVVIEEKVYDIVPVVFTGIKILKIGDLDIQHQSFAATFDLWFRSTVDIQPEDIKVLGMDDEAPKIEVLRTTERGIEKYQSVRVKGRFSFRASPIDLALGELNLPISWQHASKDAKSLRFVVDLANMEGTSGKNTLHDQVAAEGVVEPSFKYSPVASLIAVENLAVSALGAGKFGASEFNFSTAKVKLSMKITDQTIPHMIASTLSWKQAAGVAVALMLALGVYAWLYPRLIQKVTRRLLAFAMTAGAFFAIIVMTMMVEVFLFNGPVLEHVGSRWLVLIQYLFEFLYYIYFAYATQRALLSYLDRRSRSQRLTVLQTHRALSGVVIYSVVLGVFYVNVLGRDILPVLATSSVIITVIGLALREMILDAIGGMAIHAEGTLKVGDWMHVRARDRNIFGRVDSLEWRYVRIQSKDDQVHMIPNSVLLQNVVTNFTSSSGYTRVEIPFRISGSANMADIVQLVSKAVTEEISHEAGVDTQRPIKIVCQEISAESVRMSVQVYITPTYSKDTLVTKILMLVSHVLQTNNAIPVMHLSLLNEGRSESV